jgi:hypothetical protein
MPWRAPPSAEIDASSGLIAAVQPSRMPIV